MCYALTSLEDVVFLVLNDEVIMAEDYDFINTTIKRQLMDNVGGMIHIGIYISDVFATEIFNNTCSQLEGFIRNQLPQLGVAWFMSDGYIEMLANVSACIKVRLLVTDSLFVHRITFELYGTRMPKDDIL
jgi:hypothetical protein